MMRFLFSILLTISLTASAGPTGTWSGSTTHQFFPTIARVILGNKWALVPNQAYFGDCSDGDFTVPASTTTLTRDMYYNNLSFTNASSILITNGWRVFVCGTLDFSTAGFILNGGGFVSGNGGNGAASGGTAGAAGTASTAGTMGRSLAGAAGGTSTVTNGNNGTGSVVGTSIANTVGGAGGAGGTGAGGTAGSAGAANTSTLRLWEDFSSFQLPALGDATPLSVGTGGSGGGGGAGSGVNAGSAGGGGGGGGGPIWVAANKIITSASTSLGAIQAGGGNGGNGLTPTNTCAAGCGGGGGGGGGSGGYVVLIYNIKTGPSVFISYTGGGTGGTGGPGKNGGGAGANGANGNVGLIYLVNMSTGATTKVTGGLAAL